MKNSDIKTRAEKRKVEMRILRAKKWTLQEIGDKYKICRQRVHQLIGESK